MKEYFVNTIEQLEEIEKECDYNLIYKGSCSKYKSYVKYEDELENVRVYVMPKKSFKDFSDFRYNMHLVPEIVALDTLVRIQDWMLSGGSLEDEYVKTKLKYASQFLNK